MADPWQERFARERRARKSAEKLIEEKSRELYLRNEELRDAVRAATAADQAKSQFLATMSHELRTPLNAIIGFSEIMKAEILGPLGSERYQDYADSICRSGHHLLNLINDILDISKLDVGQLELDKVPLDPRDVVDSCLQLLAPQVENARIRLAASFGAELPVMQADGARLRQVLLNLISNAVKFTPEGGEVTIAVSRAGKGVRIAVSDTGIGMSPSQIPRALERFGQIESTLARKYQGTGLGLPLAKRLVELHGGTLEIESEVGVGTTVTVWLPEQAVAA